MTTPNIYTRKLNVSVGRDAGEEFTLSGTGIAVLGNVPPDTEIAFDSVSGLRIPISEVRQITTTAPFRSVWLFHSAWWQGGGANLSAANNNADFVLAIFDASSASLIPPTPRGPGTVQYGNPNEWENARTPRNLVTAQVTLAGTTGLIVAPGATLRHRIHGYRITLTGNASVAVAGLHNCTLRCSAPITIFAGEQFYIPAAAGTVFGGFSKGWVPLGNGIPMGANSQVEANLNNALVTGSFEVSLAYSTESAL